MAESGASSSPRPPSPSLIASSPQQSSLPKNISIVAASQLRSPSPSPKTPPPHSWGGANKHRGKCLKHAVALEDARMPWGCTDCAVERIGQSRLGIWTTGNSESAICSDGSTSTETPRKSNAFRVARGRCQLNSLSICLPECLYLSIFFFLSSIELNNDPRYKKYVQLVERNLQSFDNVNEWADVNPFLSKIMKVTWNADVTVPQKVCLKAQNCLDKRNRARNLTLEARWAIRGRWHNSNHCFPSITPKTRDSSGGTGSLPMH